MRSLRELGGFPEWSLNGQSFMHGLVQVERHVSKACEWDFRGGDTPLKRWAIFDGVGRENSPKSSEPAIRFVGA